MEKRWSRDWANFNWAPVIKRLEEKKEKGGGDNDDSDLGISFKEFIEYMDWLCQNDKEMYYKAVLSIIFAEAGFDESQVEALMPHLDELIRILACLLKK